MSTQTTLHASLDCLVCNACGTQYPTTAKDDKKECKICDDPRQFVPPEGQSFTTLRELESSGHKNIWWQDKHHPYVWSVRTEPSFAIGNRAELIQTPHGNILWDLVPFLDQDTVDRIMELGGLEAIVISHPHYYSTWADWSRTFGCPVYVGKPDEQWLEWKGTPEGVWIKFLTETYTSLAVSRSGPPKTTTSSSPFEASDQRPITIILVGGHFPGSLLLHYTHDKETAPTTTKTTPTSTKTNNKAENILFIADTIVTVPSATNPTPGKQGVISFTFFWSIPNRIPLSPDDIQLIWRKISTFEFQTCFGAFEGMDVYTMDNEMGRNTGGVKGRLLESCKIFVRACGWNDHGMLNERLEV